jgi:hypothetical protein
MSIVARNPDRSITGRGPDILTVTANINTLRSTVCGNPDIMGSCTIRIGRHTGYKRKG